MSQKKIKKLRKLENNEVLSDITNYPFKGIRQIIKENWKFLLILIIGIFVLYFNSLKGNFVSDDYASITDNTSVTNLAIMAKGLLPSLSNWLIASLFGTGSPIPYHLFNLLLYIMVCIEVFVFVYMLFNKKIATFTTILFAVLPVHVEAVSWISGKPYPISAIFILQALIFLISFFKTTNKKYLLLLLSSIPLVVLADRIRSIALCLIMILFFMSFKNELKVKFKWKKVIFLCLSASLLVLVLVWPLVTDRIMSVNSGYNGYGGIFYDPFFQYPTSIAKYLQLILVPIDLTLYQTMYNLPVWLNWTITLTYLSMVIYFFFKDKKLFFALAFIFAATAPSMAPVKVSWLVAERYVFLGSLGFCLFLVLFFDRFSNRLEKLFLFLFVLLIGVYSVRVYLRNINWQTNHQLWVNTCQVSPNSHNAWNNIGDDYDKLAQLETTDEGKLNQYLNSIKGFTQSVTVKPNYADAYHNRANIFYKIGRYDLATDSYETALSYGPNLYQSYYSLLQIDLVQSNYLAAMDHLNRLNKVKPNDPQVYYAAAVVYSNMGQTSQAITILEQLVKINPNWTQAAELLKQLKSKT